MTLTDATITALGALALAGISASLTYYFDRRKAALERSIAQKVEHYRSLVLCLKSLREGSGQNVELLWFEYSFLWLYAPDSVIRAFNSLTISLDAQPEVRAPLIGALLLEIRRDIGFRSTALEGKDFRGRVES